MRSSADSAPPTAAPEVAVIIPCFNQGHYLGEAIESVLAQTVREVEIIVVDDGSTDNTGQVAAQYQDVQYLGQPNRGVSAARNLGIDHSIAPNLVFLDADDRLMPDAFETGLAALAEHPECGFVYGGFHRVSADGAVIATNRRKQESSNQYLLLLCRNFLSLGSVMFRRSAIDKVGRFDSSVDASADYDLYLRIARSHPVVCHQRIASERRIHDDQMVGNFALMLSTTLRVHRRHRRFAHSDPELLKAWSQGQLHYKEWYGEQLLTDIHLLLARGEFRKALPRLAVLARDYWPGFRRLCLGLRRSNVVTFPIVEAERRLRDASPGELRIDDVQPEKGSKAGRRTLTVSCAGASRKTVVVFDGRPLETRFVSETSVQGVLPDSLVSRGESWPIFLLK